MPVAKRMRGEKGQTKKEKSNNTSENPMLPK
jgi:hypothetical protein